MVKAVDVQAELKGRPTLRNRGPETDAEEEEAAFARLAEFGNGALFAGSFSGQSPWERHSQGDELVHILSGKTTLTIMTAEGPQDLEMTGGMLAVVPQGAWHRFQAPEGVTLMTATPLPTEHVFAESPPAGE